MSNLQGQGDASYMHSQYPPHSMPVQLMPAYGLTTWARRKPLPGSPSEPLRLKLTYW